MIVMFSTFFVSSVHTGTAPKPDWINNQHYKWDCHVFFSMHKIYLDTWLKKMAYWGTKADELAIYTLSDMLNVQSFIVTKHHPWTTIDSSIQGTAL